MVQILCNLPVPFCFNLDSVFFYQQLKVNRAAQNQGKKNGQGKIGQLLLTVHGQRSEFYVRRNLPLAKSIGCKFGNNVQKLYPHIWSGQCNNFLGQTNRKQIQMKQDQNIKHKQYRRGTKAVFYSI